MDLPTFNVTADRVLAPLEKWRYASVPGYEILSNDSSSNTERFLRDFHLLQQVAQLILPHVEETGALPTYIVLCAKGKAFDLFTPPELRDPNNSIGSLIISDDERSSLVVDYAGGGSRITLDGVSMPSDVNVFQNFQRAYFKHLITTSSSGKKLPPWFEEGILGILQAVEFDQNSVTIGEVKGRTTTAVTSINSEGENVSAQGNANAPIVLRTGGSGLVSAMNGQRLIPLEDFFSIDPNTPEGGERLKKLGGRGVYQAQAAAFTHMCLYSWNAKKQLTPAYYKLAELASKGPITEEVFKTHFKRTYKQAALRLRSHILHTDQQHIRLTAPKGKGFENPPRFEVITASDSDSSRIAGETLRLSGQTSASLTRLIAPYVRGERDPELLAALGLAELSSGNEERARKFLEAAATGKTKRPRAWLALGKLRMAEARAKARADGRPLSQPEFSQASQPLFETLKLAPPMSAAYEELALAWKESPAPPSQQQLTELARGAMIFPKKLGLIYRVAEVALMYGFTKEGRILIEYGLANSPDDTTRSHFSRLAEKLAGLQPSTPSLKG
ncbi:hypothetical protein CMV30_00525 [Nibricoccus aquaticus]|uniref:Uncharacterized protein n=1 Tax=Nibricoccus aquaticus TaxID=2576891 RepID=A0A290Q5Y1_9BACT|nr:hypothetical protein CMV30_00525 [Nibricoccus aquaticus]